MDAKKIKEQKKKQFNRQNDFIKSAYDRINLTIPKGLKEEIKTAAGSSSVNAWITSLIMAELKNHKITIDQPKDSEAVPVGVINPEAEEKARAWIAEQERKIRGAAEMQEPEADKPNRSRFNDYISDLKGFKPSEYQGE